MKRVKFLLTPTIHKIFETKEDKQARRGYWEVDAQRFRDRIKKNSEIITPVLIKKMEDYQSLYIKFKEDKVKK